MSVKSLVTFSTKRHEIVFMVIPEEPSGPNMMNLKILKAPAILTTPSVALQDYSTEFSVGWPIEP